MKRESKRPRYESQEERDAAVKALRERSRQEYLPRREEQQLRVLKAQLEEEEAMFRGQKLTESEKKENVRKQKILALAEEHNRVASTSVETYVMPENYVTEKGRLDKKKMDDVLFGRYKKSEEGEKWEDRKIRSGLKEVKEQKDEYEFLFDDIDFEMCESLEPAYTPRELDSMKRKQKLETIKQVRESLPIFLFKKQLLDAIKEYQVLVIVGETGSGKTTQIPQYLAEAGYTQTEPKKIVGCTQPRRVAAMSVAARVSEEMGTRIGSEVGYAIRFEDRTSERTVIKYMTDGMLLREFINDPNLSSYSALIIDEAHERTVHTDLLLALVKDLAIARSDLKVMISSATLDAQKFSEYFDDAPIFNIPGRKYPVDIYYTKSPEANYIRAVIATVMQIHSTQDSGDILVFLTGQEEIENVFDALATITRKLGSQIKEMIVAPIYSALPADQQRKIFEPTPPNARKVVLATNIAETSITIDGISYVVDPGFCKMDSYNPRTGMGALTITPCSKASANQRAGRAGRVGPGKCFRLYTKSAYLNELNDATVPEIQRTNLSTVVLLLKSMGIDDLMDFDFLDPPPSDTLIRAISQLFALGALNDRGELTKTGRRMAEFPLDPMLARTLLASEEYKCSSEIASIAAMLSIQSSLYLIPREQRMHAEKARNSFFRPSGDHMTLLNIWNQWVEASYSAQWCYDNFIQIRSLRRARDVREQMENLMERVNIVMWSNPDPVCILKSITAGFFYNVCKLTWNGQGYKNYKTKAAVHLHPHCAIFKTRPRWVIYHELVFTTKEFMRQTSELDPEWLIEVAPHFYKPEDIKDVQHSKTKMPK